MSSIISKLINLAGNITGTLPVANGGTGVTSSTGTTNVVLSNSPTLVTPVLGTPSSGNLSNCTSYPNVTQSVAGLVASAGQLLGTNTNDDASSGNAGYYLENGNSVFANVGTTGQYWDAASIGLSAGDWDVDGRIVYKRNGATLSALDMEIGISGSTGNSSTGLAQGVNLIFQVDATSLTFTNQTLSVGATRVKSDGTHLFINGTSFTTQTIYLKGFIATYSAATPQYVALLRARRVR